jgi:type VI secretion system FHA domain protein
VEIPRSHAQSPVESPARGSLELEEILRAAGVPASQMSPEMARELGQVLRIVVQGLMEVLQSRAEIKSQLRMSMTRMQPTENNPLKFSPNVEAALHTLLVERNRGYLPTVRAFQEALTDVRNHQIAVLQGIRTAFNSMLEQFDPEKIDAELEKPSKRGGLLNIGGKGGKFREQYVEQYESMTRDPDEAFKRLFGEFFAQAYEEQMDRLKMTGRTVGDGQ